MLALIEFEECLIYPCDVLQMLVKLNMNDDKPKRNVWVIDDNHISTIKNFYNDMKYNIDIQEVNLKDTVINNVTLQKLYKVIKND